jgi:hypothetical protein
MSPSFVISSRHLFGLSALPDLIASMGAPDFQQPPPSSSLFTLVQGCAPPRRAFFAGHRGFLRLTHDPSHHCRYLQPGGTRHLRQASSSTRPLSPIAAFANVFNPWLRPFFHQNPAEGPPHHGGFHPWCSTERHMKRYNPPYNLAG